MLKTTLNVSQNASHLTDNGVANTVNGEAVESANAEEPQETYFPGSLVRFTDSGDGSGTGTYLSARDGSFVQLSSNV